MTQHCPGSHHQLPTEPPPNTAASCPECGRSVSIEAQHSGQGMTFAIAEHDTVGDLP